MPFCYSVEIAFPIFFINVYTTHTLHMIDIYNMNVYGNGHHQITRKYARMHARTHARTKQLISR